MKLTETTADMQGMITSVAGDDHFMNRITSIGITEGTPFQTVRNDKKMPVLIYLRETLISLNRADAAMSSVIKPAEALAFMFATTFNIPCIMALSTTYKESHSLKWTVKVAVFYVCNALILSCIVYHIASLF